MDTKTFKGEGISLLAGCFLMIVTMVLHPAGGDFHHLIKIRTIGIVTHVIAILSLPLVAYGLLGLTQKLGNSLARLSFLFMLFGLLAVMLAATTNGIILMNFVKSYEGASEATIGSLKPFFRLIRSFNHAFDFIFIGAVCISITLWSVSILKTHHIQKLLGWFGILLAIVALSLLFSGFVFVDLHGFRIFIFGWVIWVLGVGLSLYKAKY